MEHKKRDHVAKYDKLLRKFEYSKALDATMEVSGYTILTQTPHKQL